MARGAAAVAARNRRLLVGVLSGQPLFRGVKRSQILHVARECRAVLLRRGTTIIHRDQRMPGLLALGRGSAKLSLRPPGGAERVLGILAPGAIFGEANVLLGCPCRVQITALADAVLFFIPRASVLALLARNPKFAFNVIRTLAENALSLLAEIEAGAPRQGVQRLARYLDSLAEPDADSSLSVVRLPVSKTLIASRLGIRKETLSRLLRSLADQGVILPGRQEITILNRARLAQITG